MSLVPQRAKTYHLQSSWELQATMHSSMWDMTKESTKCPTHLDCLWQSRAGQLLKEKRVWQCILTIAVLPAAEPLGLSATLFSIFCKRVLGSSSDNLRVSPSVVLHVLLGPDQVSQELVESWVCVYLQLLSADAIFTNVAARAPCYCTVLKCKAERLCWLPGPPVASIQLAAKCMAALCIILLTEVHRKVLWGDRIRLNEVTKKCQETKSYKGADLHYLTLSIHVALP